MEFTRIITLSEYLDIALGGRLDDIDARLELIKKAGSSTRRKKTTDGGEERPSEPLTVLDYADEKVYFDGPPSRGDLAVNVLLGATLLWLPLTFASVGRAVWLRYRITDKRVSIISTSPLESTSRPRPRGRAGPPRKHGP